MNDYRILRDRQAWASDEFDRAQAGGDSIGAARMLVQVYNAGAMVSLEDYYFACHPAAVGCAEVEASPCTPVVDTSTTILVDFLRNAPSVGDYAIAVAVGGRWVAEAQTCLVTFDVYCSGSVVSGASVTVKDGSGTVVASGTTASDGSITFRLPAATYTVSASGSTCTSTLIESLAVVCSGTYTLNCCGCPTTICVTGCPNGSALVGATVTLKSGSTTVATGTTPSPSGCLTLTIPAAGTYTVVVSATGYVTYTGSQALACNGTIYVALQPTTAPATLIFTVTGCAGNGQCPSQTGTTPGLSGVTITLSDGQSCATDVNGQCSFWVGVGTTISYTATRTRYANGTGSVVISACQTTTTNVNVLMVAASGYACGPADENNVAPLDPIATTLHATDSVYGALALTYTPGTPAPATGAWLGTLTVSYPGSTCCPASSFTFSYELNACGYQSTLTVLWNNAQYGNCASGFFSLMQAQCPADTTQSGCGGLSGNQLINQNSGGNTQITFDSPEAAPYNWTQAPTAPYSATFTIPSGTSCPVTGAPWPWPSGGTITITE